MGNKIPCITLNRHADKRLGLGHPWIFSNEIHEDVDLRRLEPGSIVEVLNRHGDYVGTGFINPKSLIAIRFLSKQRELEIDQKFFSSQINRAIGLREKFYGRDSDAAGTYRAVFGESDGLPGLIIDRFGDVWVIEFHALGMAVRQELIISALKTSIKEILGENNLRGIIIRGDVRVAEREGFSQEQSIVFGNCDNTFAVESGIKFPVDPLAGQKTGFFFDQRENRASFERIVRGLDHALVLDLYCHLGAWGLRALKAGAKKVWFVDISEEALAQVREAAKLMGQLERCEFIQADISGFYRSQEKESFSAIALDPPAFITSKKNVPAGIRAYYQNNREAIRLLSRGGILSTSSCSFHCEESGFYELVAGAVLDAGRSPQVIERGRPAWDHPELAQVPETRYLKNVLLRL